MARRTAWYASKVKPLRCPHNDAKPFTVLGSTATIRDSGTTFTVRNDDKQQVQVLVTQGSVLLRAVSPSPDTGVVLRAGERGLLTHDARPACSVA